MRRESKLWCLACAGFLLAGALDARADGDEVPARVVVDVAGTGSVDGILSHLQTAFGERFDARVVGVADAIDQGFGPWGVTAPASLESCGADPAHPDEIAAAMDEIETAMMMLEYADAGAGLDRLEGRLCAASGPLDPAVLARIPFLRGVILYYAEDLLGARAAFRRAVELQPEMEWDANFPPDPQQVFLDAALDAIRSQHLILALPPGDRPARLLVDGVEVDGGTADLELVGARHFLQAGATDGTLSTVVLDAGAAAKVELIGPRRAREGLALTPETADGALAFALVADAALARGHSEVIVLQQPAADQAWRYDVIDRRWERVSLVLGHQLSRARKTQAVGAVLAGIGAGLAVTGALVGLTSYTQGIDMEADMLSDPGIYDRDIEIYESLQRSNTAGLALLGAGGVMIGGGVPMLIHGASVRRKALPAAQVEWNVGVDGAWVGLEGRF